MRDENNLIFFREVFPQRLETFETIASISGKKNVREVTSTCGKITYHQMFLFCVPQVKTLENFN